MSTSNGQRLPLTVMTYNVYTFGHRDEEAAEETARAILESGADLVFLQESNQGWQSFLEARLSKVYPHLNFHNDKIPYGGRATISKYPIVETRWCDRIFPWWYGAVLTQVDFEGVNLQCLNVHLRAPFPSNPCKVQSQRLKEIQTHLSKLGETKNLIILGDFNCAQGPSHRFLCQQGFTNALKKKGKPFRAKTWHLRGMVGFLFDHVYFRTNDFELVDAQIKKIGGSDHWPLIAKLELKV